MKVLHIVHRYWPAHGGSERYIQVLSEYLTSRGHRVTVWTTDALDVEHLWRKGKTVILEKEDERNGVEIRRFPVRHFPAHSYVMKAFGTVRWGDARFIFAPGSPFVPSMLRAAGKLEKEFDLVHVTPFPYDILLLAGLRVSRRLGIPLVVTPFVHIGESENSPVTKHYTRPHQLDTLNRANRVYIQTEIEKNFLIQKGILPEKIARGGIGIDPQDLSNGNGMEFRKRHGIESPIVAFIGVRCHDKGATTLIRACKTLWNKSKNFTLVFLGGTTQEFEREWQEEKKETEGRVLFLNHASHQEKVDLLDAMDILALPSRTDSFGIVLLEAWFYGKPVVAARAGALCEVVRDGDDGLLVEFEGVESLSKAIDTLLNDVGTRRRFGMAGREKVLRTMTWKSILEGIERDYESLIG